MTPMNGSDISGMFAMADALNKQREGDKNFQDLLAEISTALGDILAALEKSAKAEPTENTDMKAMCASLEAVAESISKAKPPTVTVPAPVVTVNAAKPSSGWKFEIEQNGNGSLKSMTARPL